MDIKLNYILVLIINLFITSAVNASTLTLNESEVFVDELVINSLNIINSQSLNSSEKSNELINYVTPLVDGGLVAKSALGKVKWNEMTNLEKESFLRALKQYLGKRVSVYITNYVATDINFKILKSEFVGKNNKYIKVFSTISESGTETLGFKINWFLSKEDGELLIFNLEIDDGVHLLKILRDQIQSVLSKHNGDINLVINELALLD